MTLIESYPSFMAALAMWRESRGESFDAKRGVYWVLKNRAAHGHIWPTDIVGVILQPFQFTSFSAGDPNAIKFPQHKNEADWDAWVDCCSIAESDGGGDDNSLGAFYYESFLDDKIDGIRQRQTWFAVDKLTVKIGNIRFYKL